VRFSLRKGRCCEEDHAPPAVGPESLSDGTFLARWYIVHRLDEELERSRRYCRPLSLFVAAPKLLPGEELSPRAFEAVTVAIKKAARTTDLVGWLDGSSFLIVMPETSQKDAAVAVKRWRDQMWLTSRDKGGQLWNVAGFEVDPNQTAAQLLASLNTSSSNEVAA
jgi:hypothetical protein